MAKPEQMGGLEQGDGPRIEFPKNLETAMKLRLKLSEYMDRLDRDKESNKFQPPEISNPRTADTRYKIAVLEKVLYGVADTNSIAKELQEQDLGYFDKQIFENACAVVKSYCTDGGKSVERGTGLQELSPEVLHSIEFVEGNQSKAEAKEYRVELLKTMDESMKMVKENKSGHPILETILDNYEKVRGELNDAPLEVFMQKYGELRRMLMDNIN